MFTSRYGIMSGVRLIRAVVVGLFIMLVLAVLFTGFVAFVLWRPDVFQFSGEFVTKAEVLSLSITAIATIALAFATGLLVWTSRQDNNLTLAESAQLRQQYQERENRDRYELLLDKAENWLIGLSIANVDVNNWLSSRGGLIPFDSYVKGELLTFKGRFELAYEHGKYIVQMAERFSKPLYEALSNTQNDLDVLIAILRDWDNKWTVNTVIIALDLEDVRKFDSSRCKLMEKVDDSVAKVVEARVAPISR